MNLPALVAALVAPVVIPSPATARWTQPVVPVSPLAVAKDLDVRHPSLAEVGGVDAPTGGATTVADTQPPAFLGRVRAGPTRFRVVKTRARRPRAGRTTFRYSLSEAASVTFAIERRGRARPIGSFAVRGVAGANRTRFSGRIGTVTLRPGSYRAVVTAVDAAGNRSAPARVHFRIVRGRVRGR